MLWRVLALTAAASSFVGLQVPAAQGARLPEPPAHWQDPNPGTPADARARGDSRIVPSEAQLTAADAPMKRTEELYFPDSVFEEAADAARASGAQVTVDTEGDQQSLIVRNGLGEFVSALERVGQNRYAVGAAGQITPNSHAHGGYDGLPGADECIESRHSFSLGGDRNNLAYAPATLYTEPLWPYVARWPTRTPGPTYYHNYASFSQNGWPEVSWYNYAAHYWSVARGLTRCNWFGNDPQGNGNAAPAAWYADSQWGGDTGQSGIYDYQNGYARTELQLGVTDGVNTVESSNRSFAWNDTYGGVAWYIASGQVCDHQVCRPAISESDIVMNGRYSWISDPDHLYNLFTHETLHTFGLGHVYYNWGATNPLTSSTQTMSYCYCIEDQRQGFYDGVYLGKGDQLAINRNYLGY